MTAMNDTPLTPAEIEAANAQTVNLLAELDRIVLGQKELHRMVLVTLLSRGHLLLEGLPGVGKTLLVKTLSELLELTWQRVQFTPDLMPGDILGYHILQETEDRQRRMVFQKGPVFTNLLLADEINRATPKTQSALLEAMQEQTVSLLGQTRKLPFPFFVLATQNPIELEGTYPLPEAQIDRFLCKLNVVAPEPDILTHIIATRRRGEPPTPEQHLPADVLNTLFDLMNRLILPAPVAHYIARIVSATHPDGDETTNMVRDYVAFGASPRAAIGMAETSRAYALLDSRPSVGFEDIKAVARHVLNHRLILNHKARIDNINAGMIVADLLNTLDETGLKLPDGVAIR